MKIVRCLCAALVTGVLCCAVVPASVASAASGPIFGVMNTSETLPDGVYFRNSPNWDDTSRTYGLGVFMGEQVQLECYALGQAIGPYNDSLWYYVLNVSRPVNDGVPNNGMLNAHYINDGQVANVVDAGVPPCVNNRPPTPQSGPTPGSSGGQPSNNSGSSSGQNPTPSTSPQQCQKPSGTFIPDQRSVAYALYDHYMWASGTPVVIGWSFFTSSASFVKFAKGLTVNQPQLYRNAPNTDMFWALGTFTVTRTSADCYAIYDHYDFTPNSSLPKLPDTILTLPEWAYQLSGAQDFNVYAAGKL